MNESIKKFGNIDFLKLFLVLHYRKFGFFENELADDPRAEEYEKISNSYIENLLRQVNIDDLYRSFVVEAQNRGLKEKLLLDRIPTKNFIYSDGFLEWQTHINNNPTYVREIVATNQYGDEDIKFVDDDLFGFDIPVREACKILTDKGYLTYWSSANYDDVYNRKGHVIQDKSVAYILIDPQNLSAELKERLFLNGTCDFWGLAVNHNDNGKYYGIWSEIISVDMLCTDLSRDLSTKAFELPSLINEQSKEYSSRQL